MVAVDRYGDGIPVLRTPVADAEALAEVLRDKHEFKCSDLKDEQATAGGLRSFLEKLPSLVDSDDRVIFYFAGHGIAVESDDGPKGFILPRDAKRDSESNYLPTAELDEALSALPCRHVLFILDCCFAGAFRWSSFRYLALSPENLHQERYNWFIEDPAWQAIASAAHDQKLCPCLAAQIIQSIELNFPADNQSFPNLSNLQPTSSSLPRSSFLNVLSAA